MGAHWKVVAREAGYDPDKVKDAPLSGGKIRATIAITDMKNAMIGNPTDCSGARCLKRVLPADWAYVGATSAFIVLANSKTILRYLVNGIAKRQDRTMSVIGEDVILRPPSRKKTLAVARALQRARVAKSGRAPRRSTPAKRSLAAQLRGAA